MSRVLLIVLTVFAATVRSDDKLKCYMCTTLGNKACEEPSKDSTLMPIECDSKSLVNWHDELQRNNVFSHILHFFEVDQPQYSTHLSNLACAKMTMQIGTQKVTMRSCQTAKTENVDACAALRTKLAKNSDGNVISLDYCDLCETNECNGAVGVAPPKIVSLLIGSIGLILFQGVRHCFA